MSVHVIGISHHTAPLEVRERCVVEGDELATALRVLADAGAAEVVVLSTCNRTEIYVEDAGASSTGTSASASARYEGTEAGALAPAQRGPAHAHAQAHGGGAHDPVGAAFAYLRARAGAGTGTGNDSGTGTGTGAGTGTGTGTGSGGWFYHHRGIDAARHLFRVVSGLDSLVVGEAQIQGQVKAAYERAAGLNNGRRVVGPVLARLFENALHAGGRVRTETKVGVGAASVPSAAVEVARKIFGSLKGRRTVVLGAGEMSELTLQCLLGEGVSSAVVANRTAQRAHDLVARLGGRAATFAELPALLEEADIVACATAAPHALVTADMVRRAMRSGRREPMLLLDIALPRDVEADVGEIDNVFLYDIDDLKQVVDSTLAGRRGEAEHADRIVTDVANDFANWYRGRSIVPVIQALRGQAEEVRRAELERALRSMDLSAEEAAALDTLTRQLLNKMLHAPTTRLREAAAEGREAEIAEAARYLFGLD